MSFDIHLQSFHQGEFAGIPRQRVREIFGTHLTESEPDSWRLRYNDDNWCDLDLTAHDDPSMVCGFTLHRPCADQRLWDALAAILALGNIVLYFPGGRAPLVARNSTTQHLPSDMVEALGQPVVVASGREIQNEINAT